jgi:predicted protein tyrosine phosphatase
LSAPRNVLFVCSANRLRSPTAEHTFRTRPGIIARSAGVDPDATQPVTVELLEWADVIFVMERRQRNIIRKRYPHIYASKRIVCLYIPDEYEFGHPELVRLLEERVPPHLAPALSSGNEWPTEHPESKQGRE